jgi:hypothetical protein
MRTSPTRAELEASTDLLFGAMTSCFAYFLWWTRIRPILESVELPNRDIVIALQKNTVVEGTLLSIRKINDFFRPLGESNEKEDDVFSYDFHGFKGAGKFLLPDDFSELHKRVGHLTLREIRHGKVSWEMHRAVVAAATKYIEFTKFLQSEFFATDEGRKRQTADGERIILNFLSAMERAKELEDRVRRSTE